MLPGIHPNAVAAAGASLSGPPGDANEAPPAVERTSAVSDAVETEDRDGDGRQAFDTFDRSTDEEPSSESSPPDETLKSDIDEDVAVKPSGGLDITV